MPVFVTQIKDCMTKYVRKVYRIIAMEKRGTLPPALKVRSSSTPAPTDS
jgi:hypothetical protein